MTTEEIRELAEKEAKLTKPELEAKLIELKSMDCRILECTLYVRANQDCSLQDAVEIVINSAAWMDKKEEFI